MSKGQRPVKQFVITKSEQHERVPNIGGAWATVNEEIFSCRIKLPFDLPANTELNFIAVPPSEPRAINENQHNGPQPVRGKQQQRRQPGEEPHGAA